MVNNMGYTSERPKIINIISDSKENRDNQLSVLLEGKSIVSKDNGYAGIEIVQTDDNMKYQSFKYIPNRMSRVCHEIWIDEDTVMSDITLQWVKYLARLGSQLHVIQTNEKRINYFKIEKENSNDQY